MAKSTRVDPFEPVDPTVRKRQFRELSKVLSRTFTKASIDAWLGASADRGKLFRNMFFGTIRWPKSIGRSTGASLASGFSLKLQYHFATYSFGAGGSVIENDGNVDLPDPTSFDAPDDADHYKVLYNGFYVPYNLIVDRNEMRVTIVGSWTNQLHLRRFLLPNPLGFVFGSFDGHPIVLDEMTVDQHLIAPGTIWSVGM